MVKLGYVYCTRYSLILLHAYFLVVGIIITALAVWVVAVPGTINAINITTSSSTKAQINRVCYITMFIAGFACLISLVGFCGTLNKYKYIFLLIGIFLVLVIVSEIVIGIVVAILQEKVRVEMESELTRSLSMYSGDDAIDSVSIGWREMQRVFECCGVNTNQGYQNHTNIRVEENSTGIIYGSKWYRDVGHYIDQEWPESCCKSNSTACLDGDLNFLNVQGCLPRIDDFIRNHFFLLIIFSALLFVFQIVAVVLTCKMFFFVKYYHHPHSQSA